MSDLTTLEEIAAVPVGATLEDWEGEIWVRHDVHTWNPENLATPATIIHAR